MTNAPATAKRTVGWMGIHRGHRARPAEWLAEQGIFLISLTAILMVFLIFVFVAREAMPLVLGQMNSAAVRPVVSAEEFAKLAPEAQREYLSLTPAEFQQLDKEAIAALVEVKAEEAKDAPKSPDAQLNTTQWRYLLGPHQWTDSNPEDRYVWQPVSTVPKYNLAPLIAGTLKTTQKLLQSRGLSRSGISREAAV